MCTGGDCPSKEECYRYKAVPSYYQAMSDFNLIRQGDKCDNFMEIWKDE